MAEDQPRQELFPGLRAGIEALSAQRASPAAGSALAMTGALAVSLLIKLARLTPPQAVADHAALLAGLIAARNRLTELAEADASAIEGWLRTHRLPDHDPARQTAWRALAESPLEGAELCHSARLMAQPLLRLGRASALPDGQVGDQLLAACQRAFGVLVRANLAAIPDDQWAQSARGRLERLEGDTVASLTSPGGRDMPKMDVIQEFKAEHRVVRDQLIELFYALREKDVPRAQQALDTLDVLVGPHLKFEEEALYPLMRTFLGDHVDHLLAEHDEIIRTARTASKLLQKGGLTDEQAHEAANASKALLIHVSNCDGLALLTELIKPDELDELGAKLAADKEAGIPLLQWAETIRER